MLYANLQSARPPVTSLRPPPGYDSHDLLRLEPSATRDALLAFFLWSLSGRLSQRAACVLANSNLTYVAALARMTPHERSEVLRGDRKLSHYANRRQRNGCPELTELLLQATPERRLAAAKVVGVDQVWDEMIAPLIGATTPTLPVAAK